MLKPIKDFVEAFIEKLDTFKRQDLIAKRQSQSLCKRNEYLVEGEFFAIGDFWENFYFFVQDEAQSLHWNKQYCNTASICILFQRGWTN